MSAQLANPRQMDAVLVWIHTATQCFPQYRLSILNSVLIKTDLEAPGLVRLIISWSLPTFSVTFCYFSEKFLDTAPLFVMNRF